MKDPDTGILAQMVNLESGILTNLGQLDKRTKQANVLLAGRLDVVEQEVTKIKNLNTELVADLQKIQKFNNDIETELPDSAIHRVCKLEDGYEKLNDEVYNPHSGIMVHITNSENAQQQEIDVLNAKTRSDNISCG